MSQKIPYLGEFEQLVLLAVLRLEGDAYGMTIRQALHKIANRPSSLGSIYTTLDRMEDKGLLTSSVGDPTDERGGRAKKFFKITGAGALALKQALNSTESMKAGVELALEKRI